MKDQQGALILKSIVALSPFTAFQMGFEGGRFDIFNIVLLLGCISLIHAQRLMTSAIIAPIGLLIHENFAFYGIPLLFVCFSDAIWSRPARNNWSYSSIIVFTLLTCVLCFAILQFGENEHVLNSTPGRGQEAWSRPLFQTGTKLPILDLIMAAVCLTFTYLWFTSFYIVKRRIVDIFFAAGFAPLALFVLGWDYARWCALAFISILIIIYLRALKREWTPRLSGVGYLAVAFAIPVGPAGYMTFLPVVQYAIVGVEQVVSKCFPILGV